MIIEKDKVRYSVAERYHMRQPTTREHQVYFITTVVHERPWFFVRIEEAQELGRIIANACRMKDFVLLAYCILPDHIHILVQKMSNSIEPWGGLEKPPLRGVIDVDSENIIFHNLKQGLFPLPNYRYFKKSGIPPEAVTSPHPPRYTLPDLMQSIKGNFSWKMHNEKFWQDGYDARIVENPERLENTVEYIKYNFRKMNLPEVYGQHPFTYTYWMKMKTLLLRTIIE